MNYKLPIAILSLCLLACNPAQQTETDQPPSSTEIADESGSEIQQPDIKKLGMNDNPDGLAVGDRVPQINYQTETGEEMPFAELYQNQPLVLIFYRGFWCPACNKHLAEISDRANEIEQAGAKIVAITAESYESADQTIDNTGVDFTVISDKDGSLMRAFDVRFEVTEEYQDIVVENYGTTLSDISSIDEVVLPVPATYIINPDGEIVYKHFNPDYKQRASVDDILGNLPE